MKINKKNKIILTFAILFILALALAGASNPEYGLYGIFQMDSEIVDDDSCSLPACGDGQTLILEPEGWACSDIEDACGEAGDGDDNGDDTINCIDISDHPDLSVSDALGDNPDYDFDMDLTGTWDYKLLMDDLGESDVEEYSTPVRSDSGKDYQGYMKTDGDTWWLYVYIIDKDESGNWINTLWENENCDENSIPDKGWEDISMDTWDIHSNPKIETMDE